MNLGPVLRGALVAGAIGAAVVPLFAQRLDAAATRTRLAELRALDANEIDGVLAAVRGVVGGKAFHFVADDGGFAADVLFERDGHVRYVRTRTNGQVTFTEYTGRIARLCDGAVGAGEFVVEYRQTGTRWVASTRESSPADLLRPVFDMLVGLKPLRDEGRRPDGSRVLGVDWNLEHPAATRATGGGGADAAGGAGTFVLADPTASGIERLVLDPVALQPLRWEFAVGPVNAQGVGSTTRGYRFDYDDGLVMAPPSIGTVAPGCIALQGPFSKAPDSR